MTDNQEHDLDMELLTKSLETILPDLLKNYKKQIASRKIMLDKIKEEERKKMSRTTEDVKRYKREYHKMKYNTDDGYKERHKQYTRTHAMSKYHDDEEYRLKKIEQAKQRYQAKKQERLQAQTC